MIGDAIKFVLANLPALLFVAAFVVAAFQKSPPSFATRLFDWLLLLSVGVEALWAGLFHVLFPHIAAASIGWQVSPFQFEIGVADISIGIVGIVAFWRSLDFKEAAVWYITLFYIGVAIGHVREAMAGDMAPDNFGLLLIITVVQIVLLPVLCWLARREASAKS